MKHIKRALPAILKIKLSLILVGLTVFIGAKAPQMHEYWLRNRVGQVSYKIRDSERSGGGTGFAIKASSGVSYIITNDHVCEVSSDQETVLVQGDDGRELRRKILARSSKTDLCLIESLPGVEGLEIGSEATIGQEVAAVGHPSLMPVTVSRGTIITTEDIEIFSGIIDDGSFGDIPPQGIMTPFGKIIPRSACQKDKHRIIIEEKVTLCITVTKGALRTNALIQPGSSGSPMVNFYGNVVGVMFASDRFGWGCAVSRQDLVDFLAPY